MALNPATLAVDITDAMGFPLPPSVQLLGWSTGLVATLVKGQATIGGIAGPHKILGLDPASMAAIVIIAGGYGIATPQLLGEVTAILSYIMISGQVFYQGPPPAVGNPDWFLGGTVTGMNGIAMALLVAIATGFGIPTPDLINKCTAIVDHIQQNTTINLGKIS